MKKSLLAVLAVGTLVFAPLATAQSSGIGELTEGLASFTENSIGSLPFAASAGIDWSNAYIGQLIDADFPFIHLGVGGSIGFTTIPAKAVNPLLQAMDVPELKMIPLPYAVANARIGGLLLPFDIGLKAGFLPESLASAVPDFIFRYQNFGADVRFNLIKSDLLLPDISVGGGLNMLNIGIDRIMDVPSQVITDGTYTLGLSKPKITLNMTAFDIDAKAQVSKTFLWILTPYAGIAAMFGSGTAKSGIGANVVTTAPNLAYWKDNYGLEVKNDGFTKAKDSATFGVKVYGGASLNILIIKLDAQGMYNLTDGALGASVGLRAQL